MDYQSQADDYEALGVAVVRPWIDPVEGAALRELVVRAVAEHGTDRDQQIEAGAGGAARRIADRELHGFRAAHVLPALVYLQGAVQMVAETVTNQRVLTSPFEKSGLTVRHMVGGGEHGWHVESNSVTGLLYLSGHRSSDGGGALEYCAPGTREPVLRFWPQVGDLVILRGHDLWHRVPPLPAGVERVVAVFNMYHVGDVSRPEGLDGLHYG